MVKSIVKEVIVVLLLILAVLLALGILFYDYIPSNKSVPSVANYRTSESVSQELQESVKENETVLVTYEITSGDLKNYQKTNVYTNGKANPFSTYEKPTENTEDTNNVTNGSSINTNVNKAQGGTTVGNNTFYKNTGTK